MCDTSGVIVSTTSLLNCEIAKNSVSQNLFTFFYILYMGGGKRGTAKHNILYTFVSSDEKNAHILIFIKHYFSSQEHWKRRKNANIKIINQRILLQNLILRKYIRFQSIIYDIASLPHACNTTGATHHYLCVVFCDLAVCFCFIIFAENAYMTLRETI